MTTRHIAEKLDIVPATVTMYENVKQPIPYDVAVKLADILEIEASLLYDDFFRFLAVPYTEALKSVRTALGLSQKAFAEQIEIAPGYYYMVIAYCYCDYRSWIVCGCKNIGFPVK